MNVVLNDLTGRYTWLLLLHSPCDLPTQLIIMNETVTKDALGRQAFIEGFGECCYSVSRVATLNRCKVVVSRRVMMWVGQHVVVPPV